MPETNPLSTKPAIPGRTLISSRRLKKRVQELGLDITRFYQGQPLTVVGLMNGSIFFMVDLLRHLPHDTRIECWKVASYQGTTSTGRLQGLDAINDSYSGRHVLIVDDILDTGLTLNLVQERLHQLGAESVECCVLLSKQRPRLRPIKARWTGFEIADRFVIGYGLDLDHQFRTLPMIRVLS